MKIIKHEKYEGMYYIQWDDGSVSTNSIDPKPWAKGGHYGFYNKTMAKDLMKRTEVQNLSLGETYNASPIDFKGVYMR